MKGIKLSIFTDDTHTHTQKNPKASRNRLK